MLQTILLAIAIGVAITTIANLCTTVYLHRGTSHRAITLSKPAHAVFKTLIWLTVGIKVREWVAVHRKPHAHTDTPLDPHSPAVHGWFKVQRKNLQMYRSAAHDRENIDKYAKDLAPTKWDRYLFDRSLLGLGLGIVFLCVVFGWKVGLIAAFVLVHLVYWTDARMRAPIMPAIALLAALAGVAPAVQLVQRRRDVLVRRLRQGAVAHRRAAEVVPHQIDRRRQDESVVVVGVLADQVDPAGCPHHADLIAPCGCGRLRFDQRVNERLGFERLAQGHTCRAGPSAWPSSRSTSSAS